MSKRVSAIARARAQIDELFTSERELGSVLEEVARLGVRLLMQTALEAEVCEFLGRERYARGERARPGSRNGYGALTIKTTAGPITLERPKLRGTEEAFASRLLGTEVTRTNALESLVIAGFVRGLSTRDVEATLAEALGEGAAVSRSTVSRICEQLRSDCEAWRQRDLSGLRLDYLYLDASNFRMHPTSEKAEPLLCAWGITTTGQKAFVGLAYGASESEAAWLDFLRDLVARGLQAPLLVISDGAPGLINAIKTVFGRSRRQRCLVHLAENVLAKAPERDHQKVKAAFWAIFNDIAAEPGEAAVGVARERAATFASRYVKIYPAAVACVTKDLDALTAHLHFPVAHRERIRHTNLLERTFGESRRRVKVIGRLPGEESCVSLVWAVLDRASRGWRGLTMTPEGIRLLQDLRRELFPQHRKKEVRALRREAA